MKSFLVGVAITAPLTILAFMFFLSGKHDVQVSQERSEITQRLDETKFDQDFDKLTAGIEGLSPSKLDKQRAEKRAKKIASLEQKQADFDRRMQEEISQTESDMQDLKDAAKSMPQGSIPALPGQ